MRRIKASDRLHKFCGFCVKCDCFSRKKGILIPKDFTQAAKDAAEAATALALCAAAKDRT